MKVLIADDEKKVCYLIKHLTDWENLGLSFVGFAHDGLTAINLIHETLPDIVITDIKMPGFNGLEVIKSIKKDHPQIEFIVISGFRQFEYAQEALKNGVSNYLLKPIDQAELNHTLSSIKARKIGEREGVAQLEKLSQENRKRVRQDFLTDFLKHGKELPLLSTLNNQYHFSLKEGFFQLAMIKFDGLGATSTNNPHFSDKITYVKQKYLVDCYDVELLFFNERYLIFTNSESCMEEPFKHLLDELLRDKESFKQLDITMAFINNWEDFDDLNRTLNQRLIFGSNQILSGSYAQTTYNIQYAGKKFIQWTELINKDAMIIELTKFKDDILRRKEKCGDALLRGLQDLFDYFLLGLKRFHPTYLPLPSLDLIDDFSCQVALLDYFSSTILTTFDHLLSFREEEESKPIMIAKTYIDEHFTEPITLDEVADIVGYSSSYFSSIFKERVGMSFTDYVFEKRMEEAKRQLRDTTFTVAKICENVGYTDVKHFNKGFKKHTGITPTDYRKLYA